MTCETCDGEGYVYEEYARPDLKQMQWYLAERRVECPDCEGSGEVAENT